MTTPIASNDPKAAMRKRLYWRANHRGIKEMDLLIGGFAEARLATMTDQQLAEFEQILEIPDQTMLAWLVSQETVPDDQSSPLLHEILAFRPALTA